MNLSITKLLRGIAFLIICLLTTNNSTYSKSLLTQNQANLNFNSLLSSTTDYPFLQTANIFGSSFPGSQKMGSGVAISDEVLVVGAPLNNRAYVYTLDGSGAWNLEAILSPSELTSNDYFGFSVGVHKNNIIVGNPDNGHVSPANPGSAYIFSRDKGGTNNWGLVKKLNAPNGFTMSQFGWSVSFTNSKVVVGSPDTDGTGAAYIYGASVGGTHNWGLIKKVTPSDGVINGKFGTSVSIYKGKLVVGASSNNTNGYVAGAAFVFTRNKGGTNNWGEVKKLLASDGSAGDYFGQSVSIYKNTIVIGAFGNSIKGIDSGSAYVFEKDYGGGNNWGEIKILVGSDTATSDSFGNGVGISENHIIVGAWHHRNTNISNYGAAYIFERNTGGTNEWGECKVLLPLGANQIGLFGWGIAISGDNAVVGATGTSTYSPGVSSGAAFVFGIPTTATIKQMVQQLFDNGRLTTSQSNSLINKLNLIQAKLDEGSNAQAIVILNDFITEVQGLVSSGTITIEEALPLSDAAFYLVNVSS